MEVIIPMAIVCFFGSLILSANVFTSAKKYTKKLQWQKEHLQLTEKEYKHRSSCAQRVSYFAVSMIMLSGWLGITLFLYIIIYTKVDDCICNMEPQDYTLGFGSNAD